MQSSRFKKGNLRADFHRPHPGKEAKPYQVRTVREFLKQFGYETITAISPLNRDGD